MSGRRARCFSGHRIEAFRQVVATPGIERHLASALPRFQTITIELQFFCGVARYWRSEMQAAIFVSLEYLNAT